MINHSKICLWIYTGSGNTCLFRPETTIYTYQVLNVASIPQRKIKKVSWRENVRHPAAHGDVEFSTLPPPAWSQLDSPIPLPKCLPKTWFPPRRTVLPSGPSGATKGGICWYHDLSAGFRSLSHPLLPQT